jgi:hypothetical protein
MTGNRLRYQKESVDEMKERLSLTDLTELQQELEVTWFQAIAAGEQAPVTDQYRQLTNKTALSIEEYFLAFPRLLDGLRSS